MMNILKHCIKLKGTIETLKRNIDTLYIICMILYRYTVKKNRYIQVVNCIISPGFSSYFYVEQFIL